MNLALGESRKLAEGLKAKMAKVAEANASQLLKVDALTAERDRLAYDLEAKKRGWKKDYEGLEESSG